MNRAPQSRAQQILAAISAQPEGQRGAILDTACGGDPALRAEVDELLALSGGNRSGAPDDSGDTLAPAAATAGEPGDAHLAQGAMLGPYRMEERIGAGGMGVVHRAHDTRLNRKVAIKVIHPRAATPQLQAALLREARLASALNHAGIVTIYDVLSVGATTCVVMEFVRGTPLQKLIPEGGFAVERALLLALSIGDAIAAAHSAGIIHRDLKPANILVRDDGQIKVLDFGLATILRDSTDAQTQTESIFGGSAVGTIGYMAPEQARAEEIDERADIFSFGVILCQMLTGQMPFQAPNVVALLHAIQTQEPKPLKMLKPEIPGFLENVALRALRKKPSERYQTIREMLVDLRAPTTSGSVRLAAANVDAPTIAVLPLINISPDPDNDYICDGLAEELIDGLTQIAGLRVVSRSSAFQFKGTTPDVREIGRRLGAGLLVHGSVRRWGDHLRLTMQLSQTDDGFQIWSQRFDAELRDLFALQDELTTAVLERLREQLGLRFPGLGSERQTPSSEAYDHYLQGRFAFNHETPAGFREALELFSRSAAADASFAPALIGIAETHIRMDWYGLEAASEAVPAVKSALAEALRLKPDSAAALYNLAITQAGWDWDWAAAGKTFERALAAGGGLAATHFHYGLDYLTPQGRLEDALRELRYALQLDPLSPIANTAVGGCLYRLRRWNEAEETLRAVLQSNPGFGHLHWSLGRVLLEKGEHLEALKRFEYAAKIMGQIPAALAELGHCYARMGRRELAHCTLQEMQRLSALGWVSPLNAALVYAGLGEEAAAMKKLDEAFAGRIRQLVWVNVDPRYDSLRKNADFNRLLSGLGLAPLQAR
jgi:serine/threonine protein kinase/tetratricopeptide (TPR) repeat protein